MKMHVAPSRRELLAGAAALALAGCSAAGQEEAAAFIRPDDVRARDLALTASEGPKWTYNGQHPGPTIRARRGERCTMQLRNALTEPTIIHWHGLHVPAAVDGHPLQAVGPGETFDYAFTIDQRAGAFWYHPHPHPGSAGQKHRGMAGMFIVGDEAEDRLDLPSGEQELVMVLADRRGADPFAYRPIPHDFMEGFLGDTVYVNGAPEPAIAADRALYRLRILNGSSARIYRLALSSGQQLHLIGNDGGLLAQPVSLQSVDIAPAERLDLIIDLREAAPGSAVDLVSLPFEIPVTGRGMGMGRGMMMGRGGRGGRGGMMGAMGLANGAAMQVARFEVGRRQVRSGRLPQQLSQVPFPAGDVTDHRRFAFSTGPMMRHTINGLEFDHHRIDARVPLGRLERWTFVNENDLPHPIHLHATHFQVEARRGGRGRVMPWEQGLKDTVSLWPGEEVDVLLRFDKHRGLFLIHCHNAEHQDAGMMANFEVV